MLGEDVAHLGGGAVAVVGQRLHEHGTPAGPVALVRDGLVGRVAVAARARTTRDRALDVVLRHRVVAGLLDGGGERRVGVRSGPPSRAATMIARESLEKSLPRFASAAPFLCLMLDHLLYARTCPSSRTSSRNRSCTRVSSVSSGWKEATRSAPPEQHRLALVLGEHLDVRPGCHDPRRADEDAPKRLPLGKLEVGLEARNLPAVRVALDLDVDEAEMRSVEQDHSRASPEDGPAEALDRLLEPVEADQPSDRSRLAARDDQAVEPVELLGLANLDTLDTEALQHREVLTEVALDGEDADAHGDHYQPRVSSSSSGASPAAWSPRMASPRPVETRARISGSL